MLKLSLRPILFCIICVIASSVCLAQIPTGFDPTITTKADNGYDAQTIKKPVLLNDNLGRYQFAGWAAALNNYLAVAEIRAIVTGQPTGSAVPADLVFSTGAAGLIERLRILENGNLGINIKKPQARLSIFEYGDANKSIFEAIGGISGGSQKLFRISNSLNGSLQMLFQGNMDVEEGNMVVKNGKIGIGLEPNDLPGDHKLYVNGSILCSALKVETKINWPDYVFERGYRLMSVRKLSEFVTEKHHLPNVPTKEEIAKNGIEVGEMQAVLLQKIEELTLYIIQQDKRINDLEKQAKNIKKKK